ncbi:MAG TPA: hypothetical protein VGM64_00300 [Lacunisphaera sp.]|jgi:hypothetical protein
MSERKTLSRPVILPLEQLAVGDHFNFAYRVINSPPTDSAPSWVVTQITEDFYKVRLTQQFIAVENNAPGSIEMKVPKTTMVARREKIPADVETIQTYEKK